MAPDSAHRCPRSASRLTVAPPVTTRHRPPPAPPPSRSDGLPPQPWPPPPAPPASLPAAYALLPCSCSAAWLPSATASPPVPAPAPATVRTLRPGTATQTPGRDSNPPLLLMPGADPTFKFRPIPVLSQGNPGRKSPPRPFPPPKFFKPKIQPGYRAASWRLGDGFGGPLAA